MCHLENFHFQHPLSIRCQFLDHVSTASNWHFYCPSLLSMLTCLTQCSTTGWGKQSQTCLILIHIQVANGYLVLPQQSFCFSVCSCSHFLKWLPWHWNAHPTLSSLDVAFCPLPTVKCLVFLWLSLHWQSEIAFQHFRDWAPQHAFSGNYSLTNTLDYIQPL